MTTFTLTGGRVLRARPLAACLALALGCSTGTATAEPEGGATLVVTNCNDDGSGSLRATIAGAGDGDTIDLSQLQCSTITLTSGAIAVLPNNLSISGPGQESLTIDGQYQDRVFDHSGTGTFAISDVTIRRGKYVGSTDANGGCIRSAASVSIANSTLTECIASGDGTAVARGGAIFAAGNVALFASTLSGNLTSGAGTPFGNSRGGAVISIGDFTAKYSTIQDNAADSIDGHNSGPGAVGSYGDVAILGSTFSGNRSDFFAALLVTAPAANATIINSTISGNVAGTTSGVYTQVPLLLANSTIAFNYARYGSGALYAKSGTLELESSIVAGNASANAITPASDIEVDAATIVGANNIVTSSNAPLPADTITGCPRLAPLAANGGPTRTLALRSGSPAIDNGSNTENVSFDQRGLPRVAGVAPDIGAYERQGGPDEFLLASSFEPVCDW